MSEPLSKESGGKRHLPDCAFSLTAHVLSETEHYFHRTQAQLKAIRREKVLSKGVNPTKIRTDGAYKRKSSIPPGTEPAAIAGGANASGSATS